MKRIGIFGSTGHIGIQATELCDGKNLKADVLVAYRNVDLLIEQAKRFKPTAVGLIDKSAYDKDAFSALDGIEVAVGDEAAFLCDDTDTVLFSTVGCDALLSLMHFVRCGKKVALANKECLVSAGEIIMREAKKHGAQIIPVDSEHSAVWQCLGKGNRGIAEIILTASGGRYYTYPADKLADISPSEAICHPNWKMGKKISVDSATMVNKALEIIEARWLFGTENISYIIHPQSIIHSMVRFKDGALLAQLSVPDMKLPISVALSYPDRVAGAVKNFEFDRPLTFLDKREDVFFAPTLAYDCIEKGGITGAVLDGADEGAVKLFLGGKIKFNEIAELVREQVRKAPQITDPTLDDIMAMHRYAEIAVTEERK